MDINTASAHGNVFRAQPFNGASRCRSRRATLEPNAPHYRPPRCGLKRTVDAACQRCRGRLKWRTSVASSVGRGGRRLEVAREDGVRRFCWQWLCGERHQSLTPRSVVERLLPTTSEHFTTAGSCMTETSLRPPAPPPAPPPHPPPRSSHTRPRRARPPRLTPSPPIVDAGLLLTHRARPWPRQPCGLHTWIRRRARCFHAAARLRPQTRKLDFGECICRRESASSHD